MAEQTLSCCYYLESSLPILQTSKQNQEDNIIEPQNIGNAGNPVAKLWFTGHHFRMSGEQKLGICFNNGETWFPFLKKTFYPFWELNTETRIMFSNLTTPIIAPYDLKPAQRPTRRFPVLTLLMRIVRSAALRIWVSDTKRWNINQDSIACTRSLLTCDRVGISF